MPPPRLRRNHPAADAGREIDLLLRGVSALKRARSCAASSAWLSCESSLRPAIRPFRETWPSGSFRPTAEPGARRLPAPSFTRRVDSSRAKSTPVGEFDPEAMDKVIQQLDDTVQGDYTTAANEADYLAGIQPPGKEIGSTQYAATANESGRSYQQFLASALEYTKAYRDTLIDIQKAYQNQDQAAIDALKSSGKAD